MLLTSDAGAGARFELVIPLRTSAGDTTSATHESHSPELTAR